VIGVGAVLSRNPGFLRWKDRSDDKQTVFTADRPVDDSGMSTRHVRRHALLIAAVAFAMVGFLLAQAPMPASADVDDVEQEVLDLINEERAANGLGPLVATQTLDAAAQWMAVDLSTIDGLNHTDTLGRGLRDRLNAFDYPSNSTIRENIAAGYATPAAVVQGWIDSPGHYTNILADEATAVGVALYEAPGTTYRYFWVMDFGSVIDTPFPDATPALSSTLVQISGSIPSQGVGLVAVQEDATPDQIILSVQDSGCTNTSVWITINGTFIGYLAGAPAFVNQSFPSSLSAGTPFIVSCG